MNLKSYIILSEKKVQESTNIVTGAVPFFKSTLLFLKGAYW